LEQELNSNQYKQARYKIVMFHHPPHTIGGNIVPPYTDPVATVRRDGTGKVLSVRYDYPQENDYIIRDLIPLLESAKVNLVFYGHSHLWNRFRSSSGLNFLESSNVGNTYGAYLGDRQRPVPKDRNYAETGDPNGLEPIVPMLAPLTDWMNRPLPYIASNDVTVFSIFETGTGTISSYRFDTRLPDSEVIKFDEFSIEF
jgi:Calcineurin-like phosphoesterase